MKETPQIRKSLHKPYWYDKTNYREVSSYDERIATLIALFIICLVLVPFYSIVWPLFTLLAFVILIITSYKLRNHFYYRYYRLIKRTEQSGENKKQYYVVQTCLSRKKLEKILIKKHVKWKDVESGTKEIIEEFFDQKTIEKKIDDISLSPIKKAIRKPKFLHIFREKNNLLKEEIKVSKYFVYLLILTLLIGLAKYSPQPFYVTGIVILSLIIIYVCYTINTNRFHRVIERHVHQGRYVKISYHIQSFISKKSEKEITHKKNIKWIDHYPEAFQNDVYREEVEAFFDRKTAKIEVIDDVL